MRIMVFEWVALSQDDLEDSLADLGIELRRFMYQFKGIQEDPYFLRHFGQVLRASECDAVMSWNFWPLVADVCFEAGTPYIAWEYDCPIDYDVSRGIRYPTSHLFLFDKEQYQSCMEMGAVHAYHLPLAVNIDRIEKLKLSREEEEKYRCDVSFLGSMYEKDYTKVAPLFTDYERGVIDALIHSQQSIYGAVIIGDDTLSMGMTETIRKRWVEQGVLSDGTAEEFQKWLMDTTLREVTKRDRVMMLSEMGGRFDTKYYSYAEHPLIKNAKFCGHLDYYEGMFKMFRMSRINLNITLRLITKGISLRALDIMAAGGFLLSNWQEELVEYFRPGVDFACYESIGDAVALAQYYLTHEEERRQIAAQGHEAVKRFDYHVQLYRILSTVFPEWKSEAPVKLREIADDITG